MVYTLISISLIILLILGILALIKAGKNHASSSVEDLTKDDD